jgi:hypothetical protein
LVTNNQPKKTTGEITECYYYTLDWLLNRYDYYSSPKGARVEIYVNNRFPSENTPIILDDDGVRALIELGELDEFEIPSLKEDMYS